MGMLNQALAPFISVPINNTKIGHLLSIYRNYILLVYEDLF